MAENPHCVTRHLYWSSVIFYFSLVLLLAPINAQISEKSLEHVAQKIGSELFRITKAASGHTEAEQGFKSMGMYAEKMEPIVSMLKTAENVSLMLGKKVAAVKRLVENAEQKTIDVKWSMDIGNTTYYNAKEMNAKEMNNNVSSFQRMDFVKDNRFNNEEVNLTASTIHVPTNIFNKSPIVLYGINWTEYLDAFFRNNLEDDPTLKSQYFGSSDGFLRLYPGVRWNNPEVDRPDMYDCRLTNWYIRAASSPKDMIIMVDISGSMTGIREDIARTTVKEIMNTLHEDDFFNIIKFKEEAQFLDSCTSGTLVQASEMTKRHYADLLKNLETENIANYTEAFTMAFQALNSRSNNAADCNKAIMVVSDGAPETFEEIFAVLNPEKRVRIFTYVIGREVTVYEEMKSIACTNRGFVNHISTMADVRDHVESCTDVFARPLGISLLSIDSRKKFVTWTSHETRQWSSIGMVMTVAQPVFNRSIMAQKKGSLVGVVGIDVPIVDIKHLIKPHNWGVGSYIFGTNHNGHVLFHPYWRLMTKKTTLPRHSYNEVDLGQVEFPLDVDLNETSGGEFDLPLRKLMVDQATGHLSMKVMRQLDERKRVYEREYNYYYAGVLNTQLSIALAVPAGTGHLNSGLLRPKGSLSAAKFDSGAFLASNTTQLRLHPDWAYCNVTLENHHELFGYLYPNLKKDSGLAEENAGSNQFVKCDMEIVEALLFDLKSTQAAVDSWTAPSQTLLHNNYSIESTFVITRAGATRWQDYPYQPDVEKEALRVLRVVRIVRDTMQEDEEPDEDVAKDGDETEGEVDAVEFIQTPSGPVIENTTEEVRHFFDKYSKAVDESFYERTVMNKNDLTITISLSQGGGYGDLASFMASVPVLVGDSRETTTPAAITGIIMKVKRLRDLLIDISKEICGGSPDCYACHSPSVICYLVDESGYVVVSTRYAEDRGKFFGSIHGEVMTAMINNHIYRRYKLHDYQGLCQEIKKFRSKSAGFSIRPFFNNVLGGVYTLLTHTFTILSSIIWKAAGAESEYYNYEGEDEIGPNVTKAPSAPTGSPFLCDMKYDLFLLQWTQLRTVFPVECSGSCSKSVGVFKVSSSNMILVSMDKTKACPCVDKPFSTAPEEILYEGDHKCSKYTAVPYRRRPTDCFPYHADEDASDCGSGSSSIVANTLLLLFIFVFNGVMLNVM